jgi:pyrimidine operon attenuation protein/uracil phosphoribosyltransferase
MTTRELMSGEELDRTLERMAAAAIELAGDAQGAALVGIRTRGALMAQRLQTLLAERHGLDWPLGLLDITLYRDDLSQLAPNPLVQKTDLDFDVTDRTILLIDDVLYTGRTARCALQEILDYGRPRAVRLAVLVDRGGREIPIQADLVMLKVDAAENEVVKVMMRESDGTDKVVLARRDAAETGAR